MRHLLQSKSFSFCGQILIIFILVGWSLVTGAAPAAFKATGNIGGVITDFQTALGNPNNGNNPGPIADGRRQINWDAAIVPFNMPGNFFNSAPTTRGAEFSTFGKGFAVSNDSDGTNDNKFDSINPTYAHQFQTFSAPRLFTPVGSNVLDVNFFVPATDTPALVNGFGAIFTDVDLHDSTKIEFYDFSNNLLLESFVEPDPQGLSFLGATFSTSNLARVRITSGNTALGANDDPLNRVDIVVIDDFLYGEPQQAVAAIPVPSTLLLTGMGIGFLLLRSRKRMATKLH